MSAIAEIQGMWGGGVGTSQSVAAGATQVSDAITVATTAVAHMIHCKADNAGTPATNDYIDVFIRYSGGDPDGAGADEYDTAFGGRWVGRIDTKLEDPILATFPVPLPAKSYKVAAVSAAGANTITFSFCISEMTS